MADPGLFVQWGILLRWTLKAIRRLGCLYENSVRPVCACRQNRTKGDGNRNTRLSRMIIWYVRLLLDKIAIDKRGNQALGLVCRAQSTGGCQYCLNHGERNKAIKSLTSIVNFESVKQPQRRRVFKKIILIQERRKLMIFLVNESFSHLKQNWDVQMHNLQVRLVTRFTSENSPGVDSKLGCFRLLERRSIRTSQDVTTFADRTYHFNMGIVLEGTAKSHDIRRRLDYYVECLLRVANSCTALNTMRFIT